MLFTVIRSSFSRIREIVCERPSVWMLVMIDLSPSPYGEENVICFQFMPVMFNAVNVDEHRPRGNMSKTRACNIVKKNLNNERVLPSVGQSRQMRARLDQPKKEVKWDNDCLFLIVIHYSHLFTFATFFNVDLSSWGHRRGRVLTILFWASCGATGPWTH